MNRLLFFYVFFFLTACVKVPEAPVTETDLLLSVSVKGSNFLDFPLNIYSAELIDTEGTEQRLVGSVDLNLANFDEGFHLLGRSRTLPVSQYKKLRLELSFSSDFDVVVASEINPAIYTKKLLTSKGKTLGQSQESFFVDIPLISQGKTLSLNSKSIHLNVMFDMQQFVKQRESKDDILLEISPRIDIRESAATGEVNARGIITAVNGAKVTLSTSGFIGDLTIDASQIKSIKKNNQSLTDISKNNLLNTRATAKLYLNNKNELIANQFNLYSQDYKLFKGVVVEKNDQSIKFIGNEFSSANYLQAKNIYLSIPTKSFPGEGSNLEIRSSMTFDMSEMSLQKSSTLKGPEDFVIEAEKAGTTKVNAVENEKDIFYFYYSDKLIEDYKDKEGVVHEISGNKVTYVEAFTYNGVFVSDWDPRAIDISQKLEEGLYRAKGFTRFASKEDIWYFTVEDLAKVSTNKGGNFFYHDVSELNSINNLAPQLLASFFDAVDLPEVVETFGWPEVRIGAAGTKLSLIDTTIPLFDTSTDAWDKHCKTMEFELNPIAEMLEASEPRVMLQYMSGGDDNPKDDIFHFLALNELNEWFNETSNRVYLDKIDITGDLVSKPEEEACKFKVDFMFLMLIDDQEARKIMDDIIAQSKSSRSLSASSAAILGALAGGIGALAVVGAVAAIMDYLKKKKSGSTNLTASESKRNRNAQIPFSIDPNSGDIQTKPVNTLTESEYERLDPEIKKTLVEETGKDGKSTYAKVESEPVYAEVDKLKTKAGKAQIKNLKGFASLPFNNEFISNFEDVSNNERNRLNALDIEGEKFSADKLKASGVDFSDDTNSEKLRKSNTPVDIDSLKNFDTSKLKIPKFKGRK